MGFMKSIRPTRIIYHGGLHFAGACKLSPEWNGCNDGSEYCVSGEGPGSRMTKTGDGLRLDFHLNHYFDEVVMLYDGKKINASSEGVLNHLQYRRQYQAASQTALALHGEYTTSHFFPVYEALERRGLVMPIELPERDPEPSTPTSNWLKFDEYYSAVMNDMVGRNGRTHKESIAVTNDKDDGRSDRISNLRPLRRISPQVATQNHTLQTTRPNEKESNTTCDDDLGLPILPAFSKDKSDLFLASMIEREADSWNLHITTFMLCHKISKPGSYYPPSRRIRNDTETLTTWAQAILAFNNTRYEDGVRMSPPRYTCKITASASHTAYTVQGEV